MEITLILLSIYINFVSHNNVIYVDKEKKAFKNIKTKEDLDTILRAFICQESIIVSWLTRFNRLNGLKKASAVGTPRIILM